MAVPNQLLVRDGRLPPASYSVGPGVTSGPAWQAGPLKSACV